MRIGEDVISYFKQMADEAGMPYQSLINLYLRDCAAHHRKIDISWQTAP
jgi:predicted DNA binding CopG/RHH family protein